VTRNDAEAINVVLRALFKLSEPHSRLRDQEARVREAAAHLASRAYGQLGAGVSLPDILAADLRVKL
jgi:hypothetical protein